MSTSELSRALGDFFAETWPQDAAPAEPGDLTDSAWASFSELGLHLVGVDESYGGSGGTFADLMAVAVLAGRHAADLPVAEATTAAWALTQAGLPLEPDASYSIAVAESNVSVRPDGTLDGIMHEVPWASSADRLVTITDDGRTAVFQPGDAAVRRGYDLAGQPRDTVELSSVRPVSLGPGVSAQDLRVRATALRVGLIAGALQATAELTRRYVGERVQFGKPIGTFQAVQAHVVELQQMAVMTTTLADRLALEPELATFDVSAAQLVANENAVTAARAAHQAHGAIGMTREYRLHLLTRRLHTWSGDFAQTIDLSVRLGASATQAPSFARLILDDQRPEITS